MKAPEMQMKFGATKEQFLESVRYAQCAAYLGLDVQRVQFTTTKEEGNSRSGKFNRTFYALDDGSVIKRLTSKGFAPANKEEVEEVISMSPA